MQGQVVSHYQIAEELGSGGMGTVYKAEDTRLKRAVALKFLASDQLRDEEVKVRFLHEAQAAAALDHPNICGVYEIDHVGEQWFMALPFLDGECLDKRIEQGPLPIPDLLNIGIQVAGALEEAHSKGIVHRDIKPGNVMVQQKGGRLHCVLMDFGLARLAQSTKLTRAGSQLGTAAYMSPEQVEGSDVDQRSDVWSLGVLMYEMTAGLLPFPSDYEQAQFYAILNESPEPLSALRTGVPKELERIVEKCLSKDVDERYQTCTDLIVDLRALRKIHSSSSLRRTDSDTAPIRTSAMRSAEPTKTRVTNSQFGLALFIGAVFAGTIAWLAKPTTSGGDWVPQYTISRLTWDAGLSMQPEISKDGRLVAYSSDRDGGGHLDIWVEQTGGGGRVQVTDGDSEETDPVFSPDGSMIAFSRDGDVYLAPSLGGSARFVAAGGRYPAFAPDGKSVSFAAVDGRLKLVDLNGGEPRELQSGFDEIHNSLWLPDGKHILFSALDSPDSYDWWITPVAGGERIPTDLVEFQHSTLGLTSIRLLPAWIEPGRSIVYGSRHGLWRVQLSTDPWGYTGQPEALSFGPSNLAHASVAEDGTIAISQLESETGIWSAPLGSAPDAILGSRIQSPTEPASPSISRASNRMAFVGKTGTTDVYVRDLSSGEETNITNNRNRERGAVISPDGMYVAYESRPGGNSEIRVHSIQSGKNRLLCQACGIPNAWSPDNESLLVSGGDPSVISRVSVSSGEMSELIRFGDGQGVDSARYSPDGRWIAFAERDDANALAQVLVAPVPSSSPVTRSDCIEITKRQQYDAMPRWSPDGRTIYFISDRAGTRGIWTVRLDPDKQPRSEPRPVRTFDTTRFSPVTLDYEDMGYVIGVERIYFTLQELTGRIYLMHRKDALDSSGP